MAHISTIPFTNRTERQVPGKVDQPLPAGSKRSPGFRLAPVQLQRARVDIQGWRESITEAESPWNPYRVKMCRVYQDTILNEQIFACIQKRKNLTLLRKFKLCTASGVADDKSTEILQATWFRNFQSYLIDAELHGYNLIKLGDVINDSLPNLSFIRRENVSPDRLVVSAYPYLLSGDSWHDPEFKDWYIYVSTPTTTGVSPCGYGLLYIVAKTEIFLRNNMGWNADYNEVEGIPLLVMKTDKADETRSDDHEAFLNRGHNPSIIVDKTDEIEKVDGAGSGKMHETYSNFEERLIKLISKILLGHADALDSVPGKLGNEGEDSPAGRALSEIQSTDADFCLPIINNELLPRLRTLGFNIPEGLHFEYLNDDEAEEFRKREDESNKATAEVMKIIADAGGKITEEGWKWFSDRTGIPVEMKEEIVAAVPPIKENVTP